MLCWDNVFTPFILLAMKSALVISLSWCYLMNFQTKCSQRKKLIWFDRRLRS